MTEAISNRAPGFLAAVHRACQTLGSRRAVVDSQRVWTYEELGERIDEWAGHAASVPSGGRPVAITPAHDGDGIAGMLGVLLSGACLVPLDPDLTEIEREIRLRHVDAIHLDPPAESSRHPRGHNAEITLSTRACLFFTSGTSGDQKAVEWSHRTLEAGARHLQEMFAFRPDDRHALWSLMPFGVTPPQILAPLAAGATLCLFDPRKHSIEELAVWIESSGITTLQTVPSLFRALALQTRGQKLAGLRAVKLGGESVTAADARLFEGLAAKDAVLINGLGLTEAGFNVCWHTFRPGDSLEGPFLPIGRPPKGVEIVIESPPGYPVGDGERGEIVVRSPDLPNGYWNDESRTARTYRDIPSRPFVRELRTGDEGVWSPGFGLTHLGRLDDLIKVRGHRVDPAAVEAVALSINGIAAAALVATPPDHDPRLVLFVESASAASAVPREIRRQLAAKLPGHAVPHEVHVLKAMPRLSGGKVDRQALRSRAASLRTPSPSISDQRVNDPLEQTLRALFNRALRRRDVGRSDSFFDSGGDSLAAARLFSDIERVLGVNLPLVEIARHPSVEKLAARIRQGGWNSTSNPVVLLTPAPEADATNVFIWAGAGADVMTLCELAGHLGPSIALHGIQHRGIDGRREYDVTLEDMAKRGVALIQALQPTGPYVLAGGSFGGRVALEVARHLRAKGEAEVFVGLIDTYGPGYPSPRKDLSLISRLRLMVRQTKPIGRADEPGVAVVLHGVLDRMILLLGARLFMKLSPAGWRLRGPIRYLFARQACIAAGRRTAPEPYEGPVHLFRAALQPPADLFESDPSLGLRPLLVSEPIVTDTAGSHVSQRREPHVADLAMKLCAALPRSRRESPPKPQADWTSEAVWDDLSGWWDAAVGDDGHSIFRHAPSSSLETLIERAAGQRVLDIACGNGWLSRRLARNGAQVIATDASAGMLATARARSAGLAIEYRHADAARAESFAGLSGGLFDAAICCMALQEMAAIEPLFSGVFAALRPGASFVLTFVHPGAAARAGVRPYEPTAVVALPGQPRAHIEVKRPLPDVLGCARSAGFEVEGMQELPTPQAPQIVLLTLKRPGA